jgi:hypothetical protein
MMGSTLLFVLVVLVAPIVLCDDDIIDKLGLPPQHTMPLLTVAITTMDRWEEFLSSSLPGYLSNAMVTHVLICDENGADVAAIMESPWRDHPKLILSQNSERLGIYHNKRGCIRQSPTEWVALLDSDNTFGEDYFAALAAIWRTEGAHPRHIYGAGSKVYHNLLLDVKDQVNHGDLVLHRANWNDVVYSLEDWNHLCNGGNWVLHRSAGDVLPGADTVRDEDVLATDAIVMLRILVFHGFSLDVRAALGYTHNGHLGSSFVRQKERNFEIWGRTDYRIPPEFL